MQAFPLSSSHGNSTCNTKPSLRLPLKPDSSKHLNYNHTTPSSATLSAKITASHSPNPIPNNLTLHHRPKSLYFLPPPLCGNSSNTLSARNNSGSNSGRDLRGLVEVVGEGIPTSFPISRSLTLHDRPKSRYFLPPPLCGNSSNTLSASDGSGSNSGRSLRGLVEVVGEAISTAFPIWVALGCFLGLVRPGSYDWVQPKWTVMGITLTMLGMGMTLTFDDLKGALAMPKELLTGFFLQYSVMPLSGFLISKLLNLPSYYAAGLILVGCCPGGTASNIVTYIARGNVALSVLMTAASTVSAVVMTPFLTAKLAGQYVAVDAIGLLMSTLQVVLLPVLVGAFMNQYFKGVVKFVSPLMPPIAVATVAVLCGKAIAQSSSAILVSGQQVVLAAVLLHVSGFFFGYFFSRILGVDVSSSRTISIEVGMQNSVLGVVLATQHFGNPLTAVPCAVSSVCHSILGSALAGVWRRIQPATQEVKHNL